MVFVRVPDFMTQLKQIGRRWGRKEYPSGDMTNINKNLSLGSLRRRQFCKSSLSGDLC
jgi:hypothetical protein